MSFEIGQRIVVTCIKPRTNWGGADHSTVGLMGMITGVMTPDYMENITLYYEVTLDKCAEGTDFRHWAYLKEEIALLDPKPRPEIKSVVINNGTITEE